MMLMNASNVSLFGQITEICHTPYLYIYMTSPSISLSTLPLRNYPSPLTSEAIKQPSRLQERVSNSSPASRDISNHQIIMYTSFVHEMHLDASCCVLLRGTQQVLGKLRRLISSQVVFSLHRGVLFAPSRSFRRRG